MAARKTQSKPKTVDKGDHVDVYDIVEPVIPDIVTSPTVEIVNRGAQGIIRARAGDTYLSIAEQFVAPGREARELAKRIEEHNLFVPIRINTRIIVPA